MTDCGNKAIDAWWEWDRREKEKEAAAMRASQMCPSRSTPFDDVPDPSELEEAVLSLLEEAGIPTKVNDRIAKLIQAAEAKLKIEPPDDHHSNQKEPR